MIQSILNLKSTASLLCTLVSLFPANRKTITVPSDHRYSPYRSCSGNTISIRHTLRNQIWVKNKRLFTFVLMVKIFFTPMASRKLHFQKCYGLSKKLSFCQCSFPYLDFPLRPLLLHSTATVGMRHLSRLCAEW